MPILDIEQANAEITRKRQSLETVNTEIKSLIAEMENPNSGRSEEEYGAHEVKLNGLFDTADELMDDITSVRNEIRVQRQQEFLATDFHIPTGPRAFDDPHRSAEPKSSVVPMRQNRGSVYSFRSSRGQNPRISMRRHHGSLKVFTGGQQDLEDAFSAGMFIAAVFAKNERALQWCKENSAHYGNQHVESINETGAVFVPEEVSERIIVLRDTYGTYRGNVFIEAMASDTKSISRRKQGLKAHHVGERQATPQSDPRLWDQVNLVAKKVSVFTAMSMEIDMDSAINMVDNLTDEAGQAFALREDDDGWFGPGDSSSGGIQGVCTKIQDGNHDAGAVQAAAGHNTFETIDLTDLHKLRAAVPTFTRRRTGLKWYMSGYGWEMLVGRLSLALGGNRVSDAAAGWTPQFMGDMVEFTEVMPADEQSYAGQPMLAYGNLAQSSTMGNRMEMEFRRSDEVLFQTDEIALKWTERYDIENHNLGDNNKAGPIVVLIGGN